MSRFDRTVSELCLEIDILTEEVEYWKAKYEVEKKLSLEKLDKDFDNTKEQLGYIFKLVLNSSEDQDGNLIFSRCVK